MLSPKECANIWKQIIAIYDETINENNPELTLKRIIADIGLDNTMEVFAAVTAIKQHDGHISPRNHSIMNDIPVLPECIEWTSGNPLINTDLDYIHPSRIDNLLDVLVSEMENANK